MVLKSLNNSQKKMKHQLVPKLMAVLLALTSFAHAEEFRLVVPFGPGSQSDAAARAVIQTFERNTGHNVVVETIPGADSIIGINHWKSTQADLIWLGPGPLVYNVVLKKDLPYNADTDFDHLIYVGTTPFYYIVNSASKIQGPKDIVVKNNGFAGVNTSVGTANVSALNHDQRTKIQPVPFKGSPEVIMAVANGTVDLAVIGITASVVELARAGKISIVGTTHRESVTIDGVRVPSVSQQTGIPQFSGFFAIAARPGMDARRLAILRQGLWTAVQDSETQEKLRRLFVFADSSNDVRQITNFYQELRTRYRKFEKTNVE